MIYLSEKVLELTELFVERCFTKRGEAYYFTSEYLDEDIHLCVKLWNKFEDDRFEVEIVKVFTNGENPEIEEIIKEEVVIDKKDREHALHEFFYYLSYESNSQNVMMFEEIFEIISEYVEDAYFYADDNGDSSFKNALYGEFLDIFTIKGDVVEGYYEGNLVLTNIELINNSTKETIKSFQRVNICSNLYIEEEDDVDYIIEAYLESMTEDDIKKLFLEAIKEEKQWRDMMLKLLKKL